MPVTGGSCRCLEKHPGVNGRKLAGAVGGHTPGWGLRGQDGQALLGLLCLGQENSEKGGVHSIQSHSEVHRVHSWLLFLLVGLAKLPHTASWLSKPFLSLFPGHWAKKTLHIHWASLLDMAL